MSSSVAMTANERLKKLTKLSNKSSTHVSVLKYNADILYWSVFPAEILHWKVCDKVLKYNTKQLKYDLN